MDLSKEFGMLNHNLLIAKLHAYNFTKKSLTLIKSTLMQIEKSANIFVFI